MRPRRSALRSPLSAIAIGIVAVGAPTLPLTAQQIPYATHDWTASMPASGPFHEAWADVKTPGDGRQYAVGTITVDHTTFSSSFSGAPADVPPGALAAFPSLAPFQRQILILQVTDPAQGIVWQRYYYGFPSALRRYDDHVVAAGFSEDGPGSAATDIVAASFFVDSFSTSTQDLEPIGEARVVSPANERPAVMGATNATNATAVTPFVTGPLGDAAGGGIAVDQRARAHVLGGTDGAGVPPQGGGRPYDAGSDAVRVAFDMLQPGVGRSDGTGVQGGFVLPAGFSGGTTPACGLQPFGRLIDQPVPAVRRVLIDYVGLPPAAGVTNSSILVSRPTVAAAQTGVVLAGFQYGFPGAGMSAPPIPPAMLASGLELYTTDNPSIYVAGFAYPNRSHLEPLLPLPTPPVIGMPMTVQMFFWVPALVPAGIGSPCTSYSDFTATPALWMNL